MIKKLELNKFKSLFVNVKKSFLNHHDEYTWNLFKEELDTINYYRAKLAAIVVSSIALLYIILYSLAFRDGIKDSTRFLLYDICLLSLIILLFGLQLSLEKAIPALKKHLHTISTYIIILVIINWAALISGEELSNNEYLFTFPIIVILLCSIFFFRSIITFFLIIYGLLMLFPINYLLAVDFHITINSVFPLIVITLLSWLIARISFNTKMKAFVNRYEMHNTKKQTDELVEVRTRELQIANTSLQNEIKVRQSLEDILRKAKIRAEESDKLKSAFLANVSHEIRTPMNGILGFVELLTTRNISDDKKKIYLDIVRNNSKHLLTVLDDIIDVSKIESNQIELSFQKIRLEVFLREIFVFFENFKVTSKKTQIEFILDSLSSPQMEYIISDATRLRQIFTNLLKNAFKFTTKGKITFGYYLENEGEITFYVKDTGIGIKKEDHVMIFERFRQVDYSERRLYEGSGLGLSICKSLVELMKGRIWLESVENKGTNMFFSLPIKPGIEDTVSELVSADNDEGIDWSSKTLLIVEDDEISYNLLVEILSPYKINILHAISGDIAIDLCKKHLEIDLILMDIRLPKIDGYQASKMIKQTRKNLPIIAQTANALTNDRQKSLDAGCDDYISKPINSFELISKMKKYLSF